LSGFTSKADGFPKYYLISSPFFPHLQPKRKVLSKANGAIHLMSGCQLRKTVM